MKARVFKYPLALERGQTIQIPEKHHVLSVGLDPSGFMCLWALVRPESPPVGVRVLLVGTGHPVFSVDVLEMRFLGTVRDGSFMWHFWVEEKGGL
jgi:hypothetical protein